eukprot:CAMPEP_0119553230 /NCGR_PEP_ID=MMETSP1352-20130426/6012_1 /TAXON_ID=265584 /ORGANISM="Stauroneis constricta, Strain CCMP1120" /LENGTH=36 /DNA_ID= /DNA_START= /DNA_END= /DNA_ORIENTATION=
MIQLGLELLLDGGRQVLGHSQSFDGDIDRGNSGGLR